MKYVFEVSKTAGVVSISKVGSIHMNIEAKVMPAFIQEKLVEEHVHGL